MGKVQINVRVDEALKRAAVQTGVPDTAKHRAFPPRNWKATDIRQTWLRNLSESGT